MQKEKQVTLVVHMANQKTKKARRDNRSNQMNPNNDRYYKTRGK